jgi:hypothetical protein
MNICAHHISEPLFNKKVNFAIYSKQVLAGGNIHDIGGSFNIATRSVSAATEAVISNRKTLLLDAIMAKVGIASKEQFVEWARQGVSLDFVDSITAVCFECESKNDAVRAHIILENVKRFYPPNSQLPFIHSFNNLFAVAGCSRVVDSNRHSNLEHDSKCCRQSLSRSRPRFSGSSIAFS